MLEWLLTPLSGAAEHHIQPWTYWHARFMVLAWGVLLPLGALVARFLKVMPGQDWPRELDSKVWWHSHRGLQWSGVVLMTIGAALAYRRGSGAQAWTLVHALLGWSLVALGWLQVAGGLVRGSKGGPTDTQMRGDHYDMTPHRVWFERLHKSVGWMAVLLAMACIVIGLVIADAPRWMMLTLGMWWGTLGLAVIALQRAGYCIDTYQAIWGPDLRHPGNQRPPIGCAIRRRSSD